MTLRWIRLGLLGTAVGLGSVATLAYYIKNTPKNYVQDQPTPLPSLGGPFQLTDQFGKTRTNTDFQGKYMLIYFGYSFCPDICPLGLQNISGALAQLSRNVNEVIPLFITIDPQRDDVESLRLYAQNWHTSFVMLTGTQKQLDPVIKSYKVYAAKVQPAGTQADYVMDHSALVYLMDREGKFVDFFPHTTPPGIIAKKIQDRLIGEIKAA